MKRVAMPSDKQIRDEKALLEGKLRRLGMPPDINEGIKQLSFMIRDDAHLSDLLADIDVAMKASFYEEVRPHLRFKPKPLDYYVGASAKRAEREQLPTIDAEGKLHPFKSASDAASIHIANNAIAEAIAKRTLILTCAKCTKQQSFAAADDESSSAVEPASGPNGWS